MSQLNSTDVFFLSVFAVITDDVKEAEEKLKQRVHTMAVKMDSTTILSVAEIVNDWQRESDTEDYIWALFRRDSNGGCKLLQRKGIYEIRRRNFSSEHTIHNTIIIIASSLQCYRYFPYCSV